MVGVEVAIPAPPAFCSFGGWKESRFGARFSIPTME